MLIDTNTVVFLGLILFVASFNMVSVLLVLMMERTPMIGLLKAFGSTNALLRKMFLYVGVNMVIWGLVLGNVFGLGICWLQDYFRIMTPRPEKLLHELRAHRLELASHPTTESGYYRCYYRGVVVANVCDQPHSAD